MINQFDKLQVLQHSHKFVIKMYNIPHLLPESEKYRLVDQICRPASSVPANIVEGNSRQSKKEFTHFLYQAKGSLSETQYHLWLAKDLEYLNNEQFTTIMSESDETGKMISGLIKYLKSKN